MRHQAQTLLAQLDDAARQALLPCSVVPDTDWPLGDLADGATWGAAACLARCARRANCTACPPTCSSEPQTCIRTRSLLLTRPDPWASGTDVYVPAAAAEEAEGGQRPGSCYLKREVDPEHL